MQTNTRLQPESKLSAILANKTSLITWEEEVEDCAGSHVGKFCKEVDGAGFLIINYPLAAAPLTTDRLRVSFAVTDRAGRGSLRSIDVAPDFKAGGLKAVII